MKKDQMKIGKLVEIPPESMWGYWIRGKIIKIYKDNRVDIDDGVSEHIVQAHIENCREVKA
jgi:hypothetical protein